MEVYNKIKSKVENKVFDWLYKKSGFESLAQHFSRLRGAGAASSNFRGSQDYLNAFELSTYLGNLISILSEDIARLPFEITDKSGVVIKDAKLDLFLQNPGENISYEELAKLGIMHYLLDGNLFWLKGQPTMADVRNNKFQIMPINPCLSDIYTGNGTLITAAMNINCNKVSRYQIQIDGGNIINVDPKDMIQVKMVGPHNQLRGMGKVQQNIPSLDADRTASVFNSMFFQQGARVSLIVQPEKDMSGVIFKELSQKMRDNYEGSENFGKMMLLPFAGKVTPGNLSQNDMQFIEQKKLTKEDIREMFQVPSIIMGGAEARFDSAREQMMAYYGFTLPRYGKCIEIAFTQIIQQMTGRADIKFSIKYPRVYDMTFAKDLFDRGAITGNDLREMFGLLKNDTEDSLNEHFITMQYIPADQAMEPMPVAQPQPKPEVPVQKSVKKWTSGSKLMIHRQATKIKSKLASNIEKNIKGFYSGMEGRLLRSIKSSCRFSVKADSYEPFNLDDEIYMAKKEISPAFTSAVSISLNELNTILGSDIDATTKNRFFRLVVEKLSVKYATDTMNSRHDELRSLFEKFNEEGRPVAELAGEITGYFDELNGKDAWKATRIARTEASNVWDQACAKAYEEIGVAVVDVIGCDDTVGDCNRQNIPIAEIEGLSFHPNHTGTIVPSI